MGTRTKSTAILIGTLLVGILLGSVITGAVVQNRVEKQKRIRRPGGFVEHVREMVEPRDEGQWATIHPIVERTGRRNREIMDSAHTQFKGAFDSMLVELTPHLSADQLERLKKGHERMRNSKRMHGDHHGPHHGGHGPHDNEHGPPGR